MDEEVPGKPEAARAETTTEIQRTTTTVRRTVSRGGLTATAVASVTAGHRRTTNEVRTTGDGVVATATAVAPGWSDTATQGEQPQADADGRPALEDGGET